MIDELIIKNVETAKSEIYAERKAWCDAHGAPMPEPIDCLNLIMKKEFALQILRGEKNVELRACSTHYSERLYDKKITDFYERHKDDEEVANEYGWLGYLDGLRPVKKIHFHNYSNTWFLDVEVLSNGVTRVVKDDVATLQDLFGFHELDSLLADCERKKQADRPMFFDFSIKRVIDTNLEA